MSFASDAKSELCKISINDQCCKKAIFAGLILFSAIKSSDSIKIATESVAVARLVVILSKDLFAIKPLIRTLKRKNARLYILELKDFDRIFFELGLNELSMRINPDLIKNDCCQRAFVRGAFLGGGSISSPQKSYHLEITTKHPTLKNDFKNLLKNFNINTKTIKRKNNFVFYFKGSSQIGDMLALMGAYNTMMKFLNVKITKEMRNNVNRIVNCETANVSKTVNAALKQKNAISKINENISIELLPEQLQKLAKLRLEHMDASLKDLGKMMDPPLNKSAVNRRMKKIIEIAEELEK